jgi:hypothetical protein
VVDTQPVSPDPPVASERAVLGTLDMGEWLETIVAVDSLTDRTLDDGLFAIEDEQRFSVVDVFDTGAELVESVKDWRGTRISEELRRRTAAAPGPLTVRQEIRMRLLRSLDAG